MRSIDVTKEDREALIALVANAPEKGYSLDEVRRGVKVLDLLEGDGALVLEEPEWSFICARLKQTQWRIANKEVLALVDKVLAAPESRPAA